MNASKIVKVVLYALCFVLLITTPVFDELWGLILWVVMLLLTMTLMLSTAFEKKEVVVQQVPLNPAPPQQIPQPAATPIVQVVEHKCPECQKIFKDEKTLRRHYGMAHFDKLEF